MKPKKTLTHMRAELAVAGGFEMLVLNSAVVMLSDLTQGKLLDRSRKPKACITLSSEKKRIAFADFEKLLTREQYYARVYGPSTGSLF